jgi:hypothetical protein
MPTLAAALAALILTAPGETAPPFGGKLPYPAPRLIQVTEKTKCDMGTVLAVDPSRNVMRGTTPAGVVTYQVGPEVQVFSKAGKPIGGLTALQAGQRYRAYYLVENGARVLEIDLE